MGMGFHPTFLYDEANDVVIIEAECYWRRKGGSPKDCKAFWRGTPVSAEDAEAHVEDAAAPTEDAASPDEEATASPDVDEG
jgi:hypothetical protein